MAFSDLSSRAQPSGVERPGFWCRLPDLQAKKPRSLDSGLGRIRSLGLARDDNSAGKAGDVTRATRYKFASLPAINGLRVCLVAVAAMAGLLAPPAAAAERLFREARPAMGTTFTIYLYAADQATASEQFENAFEEIERIEEALSNYRESSELSRINREAARGPVTTDPEVFEVLQRSLDYARRSGGAFDVTVGPLMRAWGFFRGRGKFPAPHELAQARAGVGWQRVELDARNRTIHFTSPGVEFDLGGIGKGYAVDRVAALLRAAGVKAALVDAGSSTVYALGAPPGKTESSGWTVRLPKPGDRQQTISTVVLRDTSLSTSGSYEKFFRLNGRTYCHIMDPRTGEPVQGMLQTTVIASEATDSDALSTAMFVMGPEEGKKLLRAEPGTSAIWITGDQRSPHAVAWRWPAAVPLGGMTPPRPSREARLRQRR